MSRPDRILEDAAVAGPVVRFEAVGLAFGDGPAILEDVAFSLPKGSFHFLTGPSGAGKSSLLQMMYLDRRPSGGRLSLFGHDTARLAPADRPFLRRRIGVVFQDFRLLDHLSAFDNAALPLRVVGDRPQAYGPDVVELLRWVGLGDRLDGRPAELSGGEKQRLAIARAVVHRPDLLLADEPTGNIDDAMALKIMRLFVELNRMGTTVVVATHDRELIGRSGLPILAIEQGRVRREASR